MGLNIKNERVHALARRAARVSGLSQTSAIEEALLAYLRDNDADPFEQERQRRVARLVQIGGRFRGQEGTARGGVSGVDDLYDDATGLPR